MDTGLWERLQVGLDADERLVTPRMYVENPDLYDKICGEAYLIRGVEPNAQMDWVWASSLDRVQERLVVDILQKILIVRIRLPWNSVNYEWMVSEAELAEHREDLEVLEVYIRAKDLRSNLVSLVEPGEFHSNRDRYRVEDIRYLVAWKTTAGEPREDLEVLEDYKCGWDEVGIDPDCVYLALGE